MRWLFLLAWAVLTASGSLVACAGPRVTLQIYEVKFDSFGSVDLVHRVICETEPGWSGEIVFTYPFGVDRLFEGPDDYLELDEKVRIRTAGCNVSSSFDFEVDRVVVTIQVFDASESLEMELAMHLIGVLEKVRVTSLRLLTGGGQRARFSMVTAITNLGVNLTRVLVHIPEDHVISNYLPIRDVTLLPRSDGQSIFWSFGGTSAAEARVYVEFGPKGKLSTVMILIVVMAIMGVILAALKVSLTLYEESISF